MDTILCSSPYITSWTRLIHVAMNAKANIVYINKFKKDFVNAFIFKNVFEYRSQRILKFVDGVYRTKDHRM